MSVAISMRGVSKRYRRDNPGGRWLLDAIRTLGRWTSTADVDDTFWALREIDLDIDHGETIGLIGRNGAGKSTLLRILARITLPSSGEIRITGRLGALLELGTGFHPELSGRDNVFLYGAFLGLRRREVAARFDEIVAFADIGDFIDAPLKRYSSGMRVRLAFAVAALLEPDILLLDEVMAVGDLAFRARCRGRLVALAERGCTIVLVAHSIASIVNLCHRVVWMDQGQIRRDGEADDVCDAYRNDVWRGEVVAPRAGLAFVNRQPPVGYRIVGVEVRSDRASSPVPIECGDACEIAVAFDQVGGGGPMPARVSCNILVRNEDAERVLGFFSEVAGEPLLPWPARGTLVCRIPRLPLLPGEYSLKVVLRIDDGVADKVETAGGVVVAGGDFYGSGILPARTSTPVCVDHAWRVIPDASGVSSGSTG